MAAQQKIIIKLLFHNILVAIFGKYITKITVLISRQQIAPASHVGEL
jgi:hypothetical protein